MEPSKQDPVLQLTDDLRDLRSAHIEVERALSELATNLGEQYQLLDACGPMRQATATIMAAGREIIHRSTLTENEVSELSMDSFGAEQLALVMTSPIEDLAEEPADDFDVDRIVIACAAYARVVRRIENMPVELRNHTIAAVVGQVGSLITRFGPDNEQTLDAALVLAKMAQPTRYDEQEDPGNSA